MPIRIKCPKCQTVLGVKDTLAGKKANCPKCRYMLTIPVPKATPAAVAPVAAPKPEDVEAMALNAFADEPVKEVPLSSKTVEFDCPFCMEPVKFSADLAGKQAPCPNPECKRIIKVPLLKDDKPKDWRKMAPSGPSMAVRKDDNAPEGVWGTGQKTTVSQDALYEAGAIVEKRDPVTLRTWIRRGVLAGVVFFAFVGVVWGIFAWMASSRLWGPLNGALAYVEPSSKVSTKPGEAVIHRGIGEFYLLRRDVPKAKDHFAKARAPFLGATKGSSDVERDTVLIELLMAQVELAGEAAGRERLTWDEVTKELLQTLMVLSSDEAKQSALRLIMPRLIENKEAGNAEYLAKQLAPDVVAGPSVPDHNPLPGDDGDAKPKQPVVKGEKPVPSPLLAQRIAFYEGQGQAAQATPIARMPTGDTTNDLIARLGWAEGKARKGDFAAARKLATMKGDLPLHRLEASLGVATIALDKKTQEAAKHNTQDAYNVFHQNLKSGNPPASPWLLIQLTRVCARCDIAKEAKEVISAISEKTDKAARALAELELLLWALESTKEPVPDAVKFVEEYVTSKDTLAYSLALEKVARHNTRLGRRSDALAVADAVDDAHRPFVLVGVAVGMLDPRK